MKKKSDNILITGAAGFLGQALSRKLLETGGNVFLVSRRKDFRIPKATMLYGDLEDKDFCARILRNIDIVYYLAGFKKNVAVHTSGPYDALSGNIRPLLNFLEAAKNSKVKTILYVSSTIVEYAHVNEPPIDGYVWGKYINELAVKAFRAQSSMDIKVARPASIYGPGDSFDPETANMIPAVIRRVDDAIGEVVVWGKGKRKLQLIYIDDLVNNLIAASKSKEDFFAFGDPDGISVQDISKKIIKAFGKKLEIKHDLTRPDKKTALGKINNILPLKTSIDDGLKKTIEYYLSHVKRNS